MFHHFLSKQHAFLFSHRPCSKRSHAIDVFLIRNWFPNPMTIHVLVAALYFQKVGLQDVIVGSPGNLFTLEQRHVNLTQPLWV